MIKIAEFDKYHHELEKDPAVQEMPVQVSSCHASITGTLAQALD